MNLSTKPYANSRPIRNGSEAGPVIVVADAFKDHDWASTFIAYLVSRNPALEIHRLNAAQSNFRNLPKEARVLDYRAGKYIFSDGP